MPAPRSVLDLRKLLEERFPPRRAPAAAMFLTGLAALDQITGGGLPKSAITELIAPESNAGSASLIHSLLHAAHRAGQFVALIDGHDSFDPQSADNASLRHLLWIRCRKTFDAIKTADLVLRDGNFPLVIVDLVLNAPEELGKIPQTSWYRLQRLVETTATACLVLTRHSMVSSAQLKIRLQNHWSLDTLEKEKAVSRLRFRAQRSHLQTERTSQISHVSS